MDEAVSIIQPRFAEQLGEQLYHDEFSDRIRSFLIAALDGKLNELPDRTRRCAENFVSISNYSGGAATLANQIKAAGIDSKQMSKTIAQFLRSRGFTQTQDGKHIKLLPPEHLYGLCQEILPKTPSDHKAGRNKAAEIIKHWGLNGIQK